MNINLKKWLDLIESDEDLSQELLLKKFDYEKNNKDIEIFFTEVFLPEAKKYGFEFSIEDLRELIDATGLQKLSMDELEEVAGGRSKVLMNIGVVSMALLSIFPMAGMFMNKDASQVNAQTAIVDTVQKESVSAKKESQKQENETKSVSGAQLRSVMDNKSANKN